MLTPREREVCMLVARQYPAKRIAALLGVSEHTVEKHIENAAAKLDNPNALKARAVITTHFSVLAA